jgi:hypothetical protein
MTPTPLPPEDSKLAAEGPPAAPVATAAADTAVATNADGPDDAESGFDVDELAAELAPREHLLAAAATTTAADTAGPAETAEIAPPPTGFVQAAAVLASTSQSMQRLEGFLGRMQTALADLANRPQTRALDVAPLVEAVQTGLAASAAKVDAIGIDTRSAIAKLTSQVDQLGERVEHDVQRGVHEALGKQSATSAPALPVGAAMLAQRPDRRPLVFAGLGVLVVAWAALFWFKTGSPRLALGTLAGANLVACCLLLSWRRS